MDQRHSNLGAKPKWCAHADWPCPLGEDPSASSIPPWRDQSLWRITTTKTVEGLPVQPRCRIKQQYEALLRRHAIEYTKLMKEYEEMKASGNEKNEKFEAREKGWQKTIEEVLSLVKEMNGTANDSGQKRRKEYGRRAKRGFAISRKWGKRLSRTDAWTQKKEWRGPRNQGAALPWLPIEWKGREGRKGYEEEKKRKEDQSLEEEDRKKEKKACKYARKRSRSQGRCELSEEREGKEVKIGRKMQAESAERESTSDTDL